MPPSNSHHPREPKTVKGFCAHYKIGRTTFYGELAAHRLIAHKIGSRTIVLPEEEDRWVESLPVAG
jgi:hypothetical protein